MGGDPDRLLPERLRGEDGRAPADDGAPARVGPGAGRRRRRVAVDDPHVLQPRTELLGDDLGERRLVSLAVAREAEGRRHRAPRVHAHRGALGAGVDRRAGRRGDRRADARQLDVPRDADADEPLLRAREHLLLARARVVRHLAGALERLDEASAVPDDTRRRAVRELLGADQVLQAQLDGVHPEPPRRAVQQRLQHEGRDGPADAAVRSHRRLVRRDAPGLPAVVREAVGPGQEADDLDDFDRGCPRMDRVGADVGEDARGEGLERAVRAEPEPRLDHLVPRLGAREEVLAPVADPLHRAPEEPRERADRDLLGIEGTLHAEAAADVGRDDAQAMRRDLEQLGEGVAQQPGHLRRGPERQKAPARVPVRQTRAVLQRDARVAVEAEAVAHDDGGARERAVGVALDEGAREEHVAPDLLVEQRASLRRPRLGAGDDGQRLPADVDQLRRVLGRVAALGDDDGDGLARVAHLAGGERREVGRAVALHPRLRPDRARARAQVVAPETRGDARRGPGAAEVEVVDPRVGMGAPEEGRVKHARQDEVRDEAPPAREEARVLHAAHGGADQHHAFFSAEAAAPTALMMPW